MTADTPTPTPPERDPQDAPGPADVPGSADVPGPDDVHPDPDPAGTSNADPDAPARPGPAVPPPGGPDPVAGLHRSTSDRMLAGVCGGIAARYGIDAVIVRLAFLASLLIGGAGVLFYVAAAIVIPAPPAARDGAHAPGAAAPTGVGNGILRILVAMAVALGVFCGLAAVAGVSFAMTVFFGAWPAAVVLIVLAALLATVAHNRRSAATVLVLIVAVAAPAAAAAIADLSVDHSAGERTERPQTAVEASDGYRLGLGSLTVDLRDLPLEPGSAPFTVPVRVDAGRAAIVIPDDRCVAWTIRTHVGLVGDVRVLGRGTQESWGGYHRDRTYRIDPGGERRPRVTVDVYVGVGEIVVGHSIRQVDDDRRAAPDASRSPRTSACGR